MFGWKQSKGYQEVEKLLNDVQINLENNYKDLAISARKEAEIQLEALRHGEGLTQKEYERLKKRLDSYTQRMVGYHH